MNIQQNSLLTDRIYDVLIVGAGPVGLATAIAILGTPGIIQYVDFLLVDRVSDYFLQLVLFV